VHIPILQYIEDIRRLRGDMDFMFEWQKQYLTSERSEPQAAQSYPVLLITLYLYINSILKIIRKSCVINLLRYIFI
jgi:hypothetical protein